MEKRKARTTSGDKTICLPMLPDVEYPRPELFPAEINQGYCFHGFVKSDKLHIRTRRIRLKSNRQAYQLRPDTVMPYMIGYTEEVEKGLYLRRYGVPYEAIAHVLGHSAMYWYQATQALGRISIVGATVKEPSSFPPSPSCG